jgi:hypothetical protein
VGVGGPATWLHRCGAREGALKKPLWKEEEGAVLKFVQGGDARRGSSWQGRVGFKDRGDSTEKAGEAVQWSG